MMNALRNMGIIYQKEIIFEEPKNAEFGDLSTNIAMKLASQMKINPREIATQIIQKLEIDNKLIDSITVAGAGFINFKYSQNFYFSSLKEMISNDEKIGKMDAGKNKKINVEYVSVNPTGLLHLGHGRNAVIGDTIANLYDWLGYDVTREYYFNNAGNQMTMLAQSIYARYMQELIDKNYPFPENGYHGEYIKDIANDLIKIYDDRLINGNENDIAIIKKFGEKWCFEKIKNTLSRLNIRQDVYFNEDSLYSDNKINRVVDDFKNLNLVYEKDGALWLKCTQLGLSEDRVIVKSSGEPTYRLPDIAYHRDKFERNYDLIVDILGSDHIATVPDVLAGIKVLGYDTGKVKVLIHQFVTLMEDGEQVKMSKRTGKNYTLDDLLDEVGEDVVRFFLLMRSVSTHLEFDLGLAKEQSENNPVYYLQYAFARICSIFDNAKEKGIKIRDKVNLMLLVHKTEIKLIKSLNGFKKAIISAAEKFEPHILTDYLRDLAGAFHSFYHECRIIGTDEELMQARLKLAIVTKNVLKNGLTILGISAPERM